jgi:molybdenum cofactor biosynthesis enzyme MoaA
VIISGRSGKESTKRNGWEYTPSRLTLRGCLFSDYEFDIKTPLREEKGGGQLLNLISETILNKPRNNGIDLIKPRKCARSMNSIGG